MFIFLIIGLLVGGLVMVFAVQNITTISVTFLTWHIDLPLALIVVLSIFIGMIISYTLSLAGVWKRSSQISKLKKNNEVLKDELIHKEVDVENEKNKLAATNAYLDEKENKI